MLYVYLKVIYIYIYYSCAIRSITYNLHEVLNQIERSSTPPIQLISINITNSRSVIIVIFILIIF